MRWIAFGLSPRLISLPEARNSARRQPEDGGRLFCRSSEAVDSSGYGAGAGSGWLTGIPVGGVGSVHSGGVDSSVAGSLNRCCDRKPGEGSSDNS